jgi:hypothetical protein
MSTSEILNELAKMTPAERREIAQRLAEMENGTIDLRSQGLDAAEAGELRGRLAAFAEEWDSPEMSAYDNYDAARSRL